MQADRVSAFLQRAEREIQDRQLLARGQKILVAVSGGADSLVLLHVLHSLAPKHRWQIVVAHFNHQLRGRASTADEKWVAHAATKLSLPFYTDRADVKKLAAQSKTSVEMAARKRRHEFLARVAREQKTHAVALAHHADDQVELFFLRLLRGAGGEGLAGMKWLSPSPADRAVTLIRPLLGVAKSELLDFARQHKIQFREDASNASSDFLRNRIRHELLPLLQEKYQPGLSKTVLRLMEITGAESEFVGATSRQWLDPVQSQTGRCTFFTLPVALQRRVIHQQLMALGVVADFELTEQLRTTSGKRVSVDSTRSVVRFEGGEIHLAKSSEQGGEPFKTDELKLKLSGGAGRAEFGGRKLSWSFKKSGSAQGRATRQTEFFDADKIGGEIVLRHWRAGDRFQPIGSASAVKLQDLFVNAKIPAAQRRQLVLAATDRGEIFWVEGLRIGEGGKLAPHTARKLVWHWSKTTA